MVGQNSDMRVYMLYKNIVNMAQLIVTHVMMTAVGEHPRMGALDVCPFIPVANVTMEECVKCSQQFGEQLANLLNVPVYLYEYSSSLEYRKSLPQIREGEYEGLEKKVITSLISFPHHLCLLALSVSVGPRLWPIAVYPTVGCYCNWCS